MENELVLSFDIPGIMACQRNRYPMLFIDRITECVPFKYAKGYKLFSAGEWYFMSSSANKQTVSVSVLLESLTQVFLMTFLSVGEAKGLPTISYQYQNVVFKRRILPGDKLDIKAELRSFRRGIAQGVVTGYVNGELAVSLICTIIVPKLFGVFQRENEKRMRTEAESVSDFGLCYDSNTLQQIAKQAASWLYIDRAISMNPGDSCIGVKNFTYNEWFFPIHFPDDPNVPGFIQIETCLQTFFLTFLSKDEFSNAETATVLLDNIKLQRKVIPGDIMKVKAFLDSFSEGTAKGRVNSFVNDEQACSIDVEVSVILTT